jgi:hypothetical protein
MKAVPNGVGITGGTTSGCTSMTCADTIGGTGAGDGNLISGNTGSGVLVSGYAEIEDNFVGVTVGGAGTLGNGSDGVSCSSFDQSSTVSCTINGNTSENNRGTGIKCSPYDSACTLSENTTENNGGDGMDCWSCAGNTSEINGGYGITCYSSCTDNTSGRNGFGGIVCGSPCSGNISEGNEADGILCDSSCTGNTSEMNSSDGIACYYSSAAPPPTCTISGNTSEGNGGDGISCFQLPSAGSSPCTVSGNMSGGNKGAGIAVSGAGDMVQKNTTRDNTGPGIWAYPGMILSQNSTYANGGLGIDISHTDPGGLRDQPTGQPECSGSGITSCPLIEAASTSAASGLADVSATVEVFIATKEPDDQGHGEGQTYLGSTTADLNSGQWSLSFAPGQVSPGDYITATATLSRSCSPCGTSEFAANVQVGGIPPAAFIVSAPPSVTAGSPLAITVTAVDGSGNPVTGYTGTVHLSSSDPKAQLPADYTFTTADAGSHSFTVALGTTGQQTITASDGVYRSITGSSGSITVSPGPAAQLQLTPSRGQEPPGVPFSLTVTTLDGEGNAATGYTGTVHITSTDAAASLPVDYTFTSSDGGVHTFSVTLATRGSQSIAVTDTTLSSLTATATFTVGIPISRGWNMLDIPAMNSGIQSASTLVASLDGAMNLGANGVTAVAACRSGAFAVYIPGYSRDFPIAPSDGVLVLSSTAGTWVPAGQPYSSAVTVPIAAGWNLVAAPYPPRGLDAATVANEIDQVEGAGGHVTAVADAAGGVSHVYVPGSSSSFTVPATSAMWIESTGTAAWVPR